MMAFGTVATRVLNTARTYCFVSSLSCSSHASYALVSTSCAGPRRWICGGPGGKREDEPKTSVSSGDQLAKRGQDRLPYASTAAKDGCSCLHE